VRVDTGVAALLVVHENANAGWQASLAGHRLRSVRVDGWQQGYLVPAGSHGSVLLRFAPQHGFEVGLVIGLVAVLALLALAFGRRRGAGSSPDAPLRDARPAAAMSGAALVLVCGLLAGWAGIVTIAALGMAALLVGRTTRRWAPLLAGAVLATAGLVVARAGPTQIFVQQNAGQVQLLCLTGLGIGALGGFVRRRSSREE
jgi:arabinofuranan 3-O-arabinosyltransferase